MTLSTAEITKGLTHISNIVELVTHAQSLMYQATFETDTIYHGGYIIRGISGDDLDQTKVISSIQTIASNAALEFSKLPRIQSSVFTDSDIQNFSGTAHVASSANLNMLMDALVFQHILNQINKPIMSKSILPLRS